MPIVKGKDITMIKYANGLLPYYLLSNSSCSMITTNVATITITAIAEFKTRTGY